MTLRRWPLAFLALSATGALAATISGGRVTEDFSSLEYADLTLSSSSLTTGVWDIGNGRARAHAFANGAAGTTRPIDFGDGSDGAVASTTGYTFDTDTHPNGFNFTSLSITGGTITVTGSNPLVIRSLTTITISVPLDLSGATGSNGSLSGLLNNGPSTPTCLARGGYGGSATLVSASSGGDAIQSDGTPEGGGNEGQGQTGANTAAVDGQGAIGSPTSNNFELDPTAFICGSGGPGGGGYSDTVTNFGSGASGGAGGGRVRLVSVGDLNVGAVNAAGGDGGNGATVGAGCSGNGSAGNGGAVWMQTLGDLLTGAPPDVTAGTSGTSACYIGSGLSFFDGFARGDTAAAGARPAWATAAGSFDTDVVPASLTSVVQSKAYPLDVLNAGFSAPVIASTGTVAMEYAGSTDGVTFGAYVTDLTQLSDRNYRFVRWRATLTNPGAAGASPTLTRVEIPFEDLGLSSVDFKLAAGCGTLAANRPGPGGPRPWDRSDFTGALCTAFAVFALYGARRLSFLRS